MASLVQVMLDPFFRTIAGFQSLIQKEWVMAGYPFLDRCNHLKKSDKEVSAGQALFIQHEGSTCLSYIDNFKPTVIC